MPNMISELVYGVYAGSPLKYKGTNYTGPRGERLGSCIVADSAPDNAIIRNLQDNQFLTLSGMFSVTDNYCSIYIHDKRSGKLTYVLVFEEELQMKEVR